MNNKLSFRPKPIRSVLNPALATCNFLGLIPWPQKKSYKERTTFKKVYPALILLLHAFVYWWYFIENPFRILKEQSLDYLEVYLVTGMISCSLGYSFAASLLVLTNLISGTKFTHFFEKFQSVDNELVQLGISLPYLKSVRNYTGFTLFAASLNLTAHYITSAAQQVSFFEINNLKNIALSFVGGLPLAANMILSSALINEIKIRYNLLNLIIER